MTTLTALAPATKLAQNNGVRFPNESDAYRQARDVLLAEEIELRRHIERVAEQRRALPPGGTVTRDYQFVGEDGPEGFADLFRDKDTLAIYNYMGTSIFFTFCCRNSVRPFEVGTGLLICGLVGGLVSAMRPSGRDPRRFAA